MGGASFNPKSGSWKWYVGTYGSGSWQTQETSISDIQNNDPFVIAYCCHDIGGKAANNQRCFIEWSTDKNTWTIVGAQGATDQPFRMRNDTSLTDADPIPSAQLSCTTENGTIHETLDAAPYEDFAASSHHELWFTIEAYNVASSSTYYFRLNINNVGREKDAEITEYMNLDSAAAGATEHYQTVTDLTGLLDSATKVYVGKQSITDIFGLVDSVGASKGAIAETSDLSGLTDNISAKETLKQNITDISGLVDSISAIANLKQEALDLIGLLDSVDAVIIPAGGTTHQQTINDITGYIDGIIAKANLTKLLSDPVGLLDLVNIILTAKSKALDICSLLDSITTKATYYQETSNLMGLLDSVIIKHTPVGGVPSSNIKIVDGLVFIS